MYIDKIQSFFLKWIRDEFDLFAHDIILYVFHYDVSCRHILDCHFKLYFWY